MCPALRTSALRPHLVSWQQAFRVWLLQTPRGQITVLETSGTVIQLVRPGVVAATGRCGMTAELLPFMQVRTTAFPAAAVGSDGSAAIESVTHGELAAAQVRCYVSPHGYCFLLAAVFRPGSAVTGAGCLHLGKCLARTA